MHDLFIKVITSKRPFTKKGVSMDWELFNLAIVQILVFIKVFYDFP